MTEDHVYSYYYLYLNHILCKFLITMCNVCEMFLMYAEKLTTVPQWTNKGYLISSYLKDPEYLLNEVILLVSIGTADLTSTTALVATSL